MRFVDVDIKKKKKNQSSAVSRVVFVVGDKSIACWKQNHKRDQYYIYLMSGSTSTFCMLFLLLSISPSHTHTASIVNVALRLCIIYWESFSISTCIIIQHRIRVHNFFGLNSVLYFASFVSFLLIGWYVRACVRLCVCVCVWFLLCKKRKFLTKNWPNELLSISVFYAVFHFENRIWAHF